MRRGELLLDLQRRGLTHPPDRAIGDGALGFWNALREASGATKEQRCWFHQTGKALNAMPKSVQAKAKGHLHDIWQAETRVDAEAAFDFYVASYGVKYNKAATKSAKDRDALLAFYDFPAEHWKHTLGLVCKSRYFNTSDSHQHGGRCEKACGGGQYRGEEHYFFQNRHVHVLDFVTRR